MSFFISLFSLEDILQPQQIFGLVVYVKFLIVRLLMVVAVHRIMAAPAKKTQAAVAKFWDLSVQRSQRLSPLSGWLPDSDCGGKILGPIVASVF